MSYTPPVTKDDVFFYGSDGFYVEVSENGQYPRHRHSRAEPFRLYALLTYKDQGPILTKKGILAKRQPPKYQDESSHFYCAQLIHYGLKPLKTKVAAKKSLLAAFGTSKVLRVPKEMLKLEKELKVMYERNNAEAKKRREKEKREQEKAEAKRQIELRKKQEAIRKDVLAAAKGKTKAVAGSKKRKAPGDDNQPGPSKNKKNKASKLKITSSDLSMFYDITSPKLTHQYDSSEMTMKMSTSRNSLTKGHLWISFNFGVVSGIMRSQAFPFPSNGTLSLQWRGRVSGEGEMTFSKSNTVSITFLGDGRLQGVIYGSYMGTNGTPFFGTENRQRSRNVVWIKSVSGWKRIWRGMNSTAYGAGSRARWGKWSGDEGYTERAADSDTSGPRGASLDPEDNDEEDFGTGW